MFTKYPLAAFVVCLLNGAVWSSDAVWTTAAATEFGRRSAGYGPFETTALEIEGGTIHVALGSGRFSLSKEAILVWVKTAAQAVSRYHGRFPVDRVNLILIPTAAGSISSGVTYGGRLIQMRMGPKTTPQNADRDWMLTHEMLHLGFPDLDESHRWMEEGMAVYLEPIARIGIQNIPAEEMWRGLVRGLPNGLPQKGDLGLERTHTWGRTYWGGTLFWFMADIEIREQTQNKHSVRDAIKAIREAGGNNTQRWEIEKVLEVGDQATKTDVLHKLYAEMAAKSQPIDLDALWKKLGVTLTRDGKIEYNDEAPLASIRKAITEVKEPEKRVACPQQA